MGLELLLTDIAGPITPLPAADTHHLLTTKLSHSVVSFCCNALFLCAVISFRVVCFSVIFLIFPNQTINTSEMTMKTQVNDTSITPIIHATTTIKETNIYTAICSFSLFAAACWSYSDSKWSSLFIVLVESHRRWIPEVSETEFCLTGSQILLFVTARELWFHAVISF